MVRVHVVNHQSEGRLTIQLTEVILGVIVSRPISKRFFTLVAERSRQEQRLLTEDDFNMFLHLNTEILCLQKCEKYSGLNLFPTSANKF